LKRIVLAFLLVLSLFAVTSFAAEMTGYISDSKCGAKGEKDAHADCAVKCVKGGAAPVFVSNGKVYKIDDAAKGASESPRGSSRRPAGNCPLNHDGASINQFMRSSWSPAASRRNLAKQRWCSRVGSPASPSITRRARHPTSPRSTSSCAAAST